MLLSSLRETGETQGWPPASNRTTTTRQKMSEYGILWRVYNINLAPAAAVCMEKVDYGELRRRLRRHFLQTACLSGLLLLACCRILGQQQCDCSMKQSQPASQPARPASSTEAGAAYSGATRWLDCNAKRCQIEATPPPVLLSGCRL